MASIANFAQLAIVWHGQQELWFSVVGPKGHLVVRRAGESHFLAGRTGAVAGNSRMTSTILSEEHLRQLIEIIWKEGVVLPDNHHPVSGKYQYSNLSLGFELTIGHGDVTSQLTPRFHAQLSFDWDTAVRTEHRFKNLVFQGCNTSICSLKHDSRRVPSDFAEVLASAYKGQC
jgi:hypothetical protein